MADLNIIPSITEGYGGATTAIGWGLLGFAAVFRFSMNEWRRNLGEPVNQAEALAEVVLAAACLATYPWISYAIFWGFEMVGIAILNEAERVTMGDRFSKIAGYYGDLFSTGNFFRFHANFIKDAAVRYAGMLAAIIALLGNSLISTIQAMVYNVLFAFAPLMIAGSVFGLPTLRIWLMGLLQISSWSIAISVVFANIENTLKQWETVSATQTNFFDDHFIDVMDTLLFMGTATLWVPALSSVIFHIGVLGPLAQSSAGSSIVAGLTSRLQRWAPSSPTGPAGESAIKTNNASGARPGDL